MKVGRGPTSTKKVWPPSPVTRRRTTRLRCRPGVYRQTLSRTLCSVTQAKVSVVPHWGTWPHGGPSCITQAKPNFWDLLRTGTTPHRMGVGLRGHFCSRTHRFPYIGWGIFSLTMNIPIGELWPISATPLVTSQRLD